METAISIPDDVFYLSEKLAKRLKVSCNRIFAIAQSDLLEYVEILSERKIEQIDKGLRLILSL